MIIAYSMDETRLTTPYSEFWAGARDTLPLIIGAIPFGFIFGALAVNSGLTPAATVAMSAFVFAGSAQFIAAGLVGGGVGVGIIVLTTFVVNLRHMLYAATLAPHVKHLSQRWLVPLGFWLTDETFAIAANRYNRSDESPHKHWYQLGSSVAMYSNWQLCTLLGIFAGQALEDAGQLGLDFAMVVTFIGLVIPMIKTRPALVAVLVAGVTALLAYGLPNQLGLMVAALVGVGAGLAAESIWKPTPIMQKETGS